MYLDKELNKLPKEQIRKIWIFSESICDLEWDDPEDDSPYAGWSENCTPFVDDQGYLNENDALPCSEAYPVWSIDELKTGDTLYVLWVSYSTGNTFGSSEGNCEIIAVYKDEDIANEACKVWYESQYSRDETYTINTPFAPDVHIPISNPGSGYFRDLSDVNLKTITVV